MAFVFSPWYFVMIALVIGIIACFIVFFKMDKTDKEIIKKFVEETQKQAELEAASEGASNKTEETASEEETTN